MCLETTVDHRLAIYRYPGTQFSTAGGAVMCEEDCAWTLASTTLWTTETVIDYFHFEYCIVEEAEHRERSQAGLKAVLPRPSCSVERWSSVCIKPPTRTNVGSDARVCRTSYARSRTICTCPRVFPTRAHMQDKAEGQNCTHRYDFSPN
jgi:hypothetical protein